MNTTDVADDMTSMPTRQCIQAPSQSEHKMISLTHTHAQIRRRCGNEELFFLCQHEILLNKSETPRPSPEPAGEGGRE
ncbi:hypothetical protein BgiBS90_007249 [Biomphalaria glabrata]|nr:hypothetical protein BgiMline_008904 [Biomphalaria glabrata]KAI8791785.1 hypothetical protein BgiBS90_007249 [Biomphalaria glabrata]